MDKKLIYLHNVNIQVYIHVQLPQYTVLYVIF